MIRHETALFMIDRLRTMTDQERLEWICLLPDDMQAGVMQQLIDLLNTNPGEND